MKRLLAGIAMSMNSAEGSRISFGLKGGEGSVSSSIGSSVSVEMVTNPTTGYDWRIVGEIPDCLAASEAQYKKMPTPEGKHLIGAPSIKEYTFTATDVCQTDIRFEYIHASEKKEKSVPYIIVHLSVVSDELL